MIFRFQSNTKKSSQNNLKNIYFDHNWNAVITMTLAVYTISALAMKIMFNVKKVQIYEKQDQNLSRSRCRNIFFWNREPASFKILLALEWTMVEDSVDWRNRVRTDRRTPESVSAKFCYEALFITGLSVMHYF